MQFKLDVLIDVKSVLKPIQVCNQAQEEHHKQVSDLEVTDDDNLNKIEKSDYFHVRRSAQRAHERRMSLINAANSISNNSYCENPQTDPNQRGASTGRVIEKNKFGSFISFGQKRFARIESASHMTYKSKDKVVSFQSPSSRFVEDRQFDNQEEALFRLGEKKLAAKKSFTRFDRMKWNDEDFRSSLEIHRTNRHKIDELELESVQSCESVSSGNSEIFKMMKIR